MIKLTAAEFASIVNGELCNLEPNEIIDQTPVINSKEAKVGSFFAAFVGENLDGHLYVKDAISNGAKFALVSKSVTEPSILVADVGAALLKLTTYVRSHIKDLKVIGITGSQGKTTTKEYLNSILSLVGETVATQGNFNTDIGVPLTVLRCTNETKFCIVEMGARHMGDIAKLTIATKPDVGVVLVVGTAHLGEFGSVENIAKTKGELIKELTGNAIAVLGNFDPYTPKMADGLPITKLVIGEDVRAADLELPGGFAHFDLVTKTGRVPVSLQQLGEHQVPNALAAATAASALGVSNEKIADGLTTAVVSSKWRMEISEFNDLTVINDFYNANPESMKAALKSLVLLSQVGGGASWAIVGKMHELGEMEKSAHLEIVKYAAQIGVDHLVSVGTDLYGVENTKELLQEMSFHKCNDLSAVLELSNNFSAGDVLLLKASRSEKFEDIAQALKAKWMEIES
jgi:UDP-N-acetylmuramoyl-tripeptide--D-alanyl-D-alanine ligase